MTFELLQCFEPSQAEPLMKMESKKRLVLKTDKH